MTTLDPSQEVADLEKKLEDVTTRFARMPGAMWLAATAIIESATRLGDALVPALAERRAELLVRARRARDEAGPRSSENDVSAITLWVELAEKRAALETKVRSALEAVRAHRAAHAFLGPTPSSRKSLERALEERERDVVERARRLALPVDEREEHAVEALRAREASPSVDELASDLELAARCERARARLAASPGAWRSLAGVGLALAGLALAIVVDVTVVRALAALLAVAGLAFGLVSRARSARARESDLVEAHGLARRDAIRRPIAEEDQRLLVAAARALGALDAFGATEDGRTLEDRESKLVALAPWIRELVSGFTAEEAARFG